MKHIGKNRKIKKGQHLFKNSLVIFSACPKNFLMPYDVTNTISNHNNKILSFVDSAIPFTFFRMFKNLSRNL